MLITIEGIYRKGNIELAEMPTGLEEAPVLVTFLPASVPVAQPRVLNGAWQGRMPANLDVEAVLKDIRRQWTQEWESEPHE